MGMAATDVIPLWLQMAGSLWLVVFAHLPAAGIQSGDQVVAAMTPNVEEMIGQVQTIAEDMGWVSGG
jgi:hypothetical protein